MKIGIASDEKTRVTDFVVEYIKKLGHDVELFGPLNFDIGNVERVKNYESTK